MTDKELWDALDKMSDEEFNDMAFSALGGTKKKTKNYIVGQYYNKLGIFVGDFGEDDIVEKDGRYIYPAVEDAKQKYGLRFTNRKNYKKGNEWRTQYFVCDMNDCSFGF